MDFLEGLTPGKGLFIGAFDGVDVRETMDAFLLARCSAVTWLDYVET